MRQFDNSYPRQTIRPSEEFYSTKLNDLATPPKTLYTIGDPSILDAGVAILGVRKSTPYGNTVAHDMAAQAASIGCAIVSGGALGIHTAAIQGALEYAGKVVVVFGSGADVIYPAQNAELFKQVLDCGGCIISEQPWGTPAMPYSFRSRNRLIAALADLTLVVETGVPSGTFSTVEEALDLGRKVAAIPGSIASPQSKGCNVLIADGDAECIDSAARFADLLCDTTA